MIFQSVKFEKIKIPNGLTVKCVLRADGLKSEATVPYGTSAGKYEVSCFSNFGLDAAIKNFPDLKGKSFKTLNSLEKEILRYDSERFVKIGGNLVLALSVAFLRLKAKLEGKELFNFFSGKRVPNQLGKVVGGGKHAPKGPDFQEFLIYSDKPFKHAVNLNKMFHKRLGAVLGVKTLDLEGGWVVNLSEEKVLDKIADLRDDSFPEIKIGLDIAASSFYKKGRYYYKNRVIGGKSQLDYVNGLIKKYDLFYVEDPFHEDDFDSFAELQAKSKNCLVCGDDLLVTNPDRLWRAVGKSSCRAAIVKPNQIGLLSKMSEFVKDCKKNRVQPVFSHRSKESFDDWLADMSVGTKMMKMGIVGKERESKIKRLSKIVF
ncbi:MAG: hypothetical protein GON13_01905 [Nanoarchaeota archaeon]|nr:hypothetical protein [Nanoarchaeota archaeon]